jgi:hypothetical protein
MKIAYNSKGVLSRRSTNTIINAPLSRVVNRLRDKGFVNNRLKPTRNGKYINVDLWNIIDSHKSIERGILNYYKLANNYSNLAARVHYYLKYSCALTICSKMKLRTLRGTFRKYGKNLTIRDGEKVISYPPISYKRPALTPNLKARMDVDPLIDQLTSRFRRHVGNLTGPCIVCGSVDDIEVHHVRALKDIKNKKNWLSKMMARYSRKQVPVCKSCHIKIHKGQYDGRKL